MDRSATSAPDRAAAVRTARRAALDLLLPAAAGDGGEPSAAPAAVRSVFGMPVHRQPPHGRHAGGQPQAHPAADAHRRHRSPLPQTELEPSGAGPRDLSIPAAGCVDRPAQPSLEHRYYLHSDAWRLPIFGGGHGLVQPLRAQLGTVQHDGNRLLPGGAGSGVPLRPARDLELRSGFAVHLGGVSRAAEEARHLDQYGWARSRPGQRFHRAPVAQPEVRADLPRRLRQRGRVVPGAGSLLKRIAPVPRRSRIVVYGFLLGAFEQIVGWMPGYTARTPPGPATPATALGASPSLLLLGESFRKPVPGVAVSLCAGNGLSRFSGKGFRRPCASRRRYPDNLCLHILAC